MEHNILHYNTIFPATSQSAIWSLVFLREKLSDYIQINLFYQGSQLLCKNDINLHHIQSCEHGFGDIFNPIISKKLLLKAYFCILLLKVLVIPQHIEDLVKQALHSFGNKKTGPSPGHTNICLKWEGGEGGAIAFTNVS